MNIHQSHSFPSPSAEAPGRLRVDGQRAQILERGVCVQAAYNSVCAIEYLKSHNIAAELIMRVLLQPRSRRCGAGA